MELIGSLMTSEVIFVRFLLLLLLCLSLLGHSSVVALRRSWNQVEEIQESTSKLEPSFVGRINNQTVNVGRDVILGCQVQNLISDYKVGWLKVSDQTILTLHKRVITHNARIHVTHDEQRTWNLLIKNVQPEDEGCYMCQINTAVMKKELGCISVQVPPDIQLEKTSSDITVNEGEDATLVCHASGRPQPTIVWRREDKKAFHVRSSKKMVTEYTGEFLVLHRVRRKDMGAFFCIAKNMVPPSVSKRIMLNVNFPPNVSLDNQLVGSPIGEKVTLRCRVEAYPSAITYWIRSGDNGKDEMLINGSEFIIEERKLEYKTELTLEIAQFSQRHVGLYTCTATNSFGMKENKVRIYEMAQKTNTPVATTISSSSYNVEVTEDRGGSNQISQLNTQKPHQGGYYTSGDTDDTNNYYRNHKTPLISSMASRNQIFNHNNILLLIINFILLPFLHFCTLF